MASPRRSTVTPALRRSAAQIGFLLVHVIADGAACHGADRAADQGVGAGLIAIAERADCGAGEAADDGALRRVRGLRLLGIRIDGLAARKEAAGKGESNQARGTQHIVSPNGSGARKERITAPS
jgi:hypothetical protein